MSKETLVSKVGSCNSLTAGASACAQIAGLRLQGMDVGALRKTLQDHWGVMLNHALYHAGGQQLKVLSMGFRYIRKSLELFTVPPPLFVYRTTNLHTCVEIS